MAHNSKIVILSSKILTFYRGLSLPLTFISFQNRRVFAKARCFLDICHAPRPDISRHM